MYSQCHLYLLSPLVVLPKIGSFCIIQIKYWIETLPTSGCLIHLMGSFSLTEVSIQIVYHCIGAAYHWNNAFPYMGRNSCFLHRENWKRVVLVAVLIEVPKLMKLLERKHLVSYHILINVLKDTVYQNLQANNRRPSPANSHSSSLPSTYSSLLRLPDSWQD